MNDWGVFGRTYENVAKTLSKHLSINHVTVILPPVRTGRKVSPPFAIKHISNALMVITPSVKLFEGKGSFYRIRNWLNDNAPGLSIRAYLKLLGYRKNNTIMWMYPPGKYIYNLLEEIPYTLLVSQIVDNNLFLETLGSNEIDFIKSQYAELARMSDFVITSSESNLDFFSKINANTHNFINAVDSDFIGAPSEMPYKINSARPKLAYVGWITQRTDIELLKFVAESRPGYDIIIVGPDEGALGASGIKSLYNVHYLGPMPYEQLPGFLSGVDVCLIPHIDSKYSRSMSPLKIFQYLASGRPVVSTCISGIMHWQDLIYIANDYQSFVDLIDKVLVDDNALYSKKRICKAREETWEKRVDDMLNVILSTDAS